MSWLGDVVGFENFHGKEILHDLGRQPWRLLTGVDPASTGLWNKVLGRHDSAIVDQMGGATGQRYKDAEAAGINTGPGKGMQNLAHVIAAAYAGGEGASALGGGAEGAGAVGDAGMGASNAMGTAGGGSSGGAGGLGGLFGGGGGSSGGASSGGFSAIKPQMWGQLGSLVGNPQGSSGNDAATRAALMAQLLRRQNEEQNNFQPSFVDMG